ncbi:hypothetical protein K490DRAFT_53364 [Saccharata proteae CBS 121410]|uniref:Secreted protein n=1 Tax=Saccharata proteae CBS 121410 TaxID=1314787 RepID=A0A9P4I3T9_9PEZI|nr:hypothetical protein K490DRAFT_53364 [Saccharata proteae CBS 121410]
MAADEECWCLCLCLCLCLSVSVPRESKATLPVPLPLIPLGRTSERVCSQCGGHSRPASSPGFGDRAQRAAVPAQGTRETNAQPSARRDKQDKQDTTTRRREHAESRTRHSIRHARDLRPALLKPSKPAASSQQPDANGQTPKPRTQNPDANCATSVLCLSPDRRASSTSKVASRRAVSATSPPYLSLSHGRPAVDGSRRARVFGSAGGS